MSVVYSNMEWLKGLAGKVRRDPVDDDETAEAPPISEPEEPLLETPQEHKERWRSVYVIYFTMFQMSLGFSIVLTGVWPYLDKVSWPFQGLQANAALSEVVPYILRNCLYL